MKKEKTEKKVFTATEILELKPVTRKRAVTSGKWTTDIEGNMSYDGDRYFIEKQRISEKDWIVHLQGKRWMDWNEFIPCYLQSCINQGIGEVTIKTIY